MLSHWHLDHIAGTEAFADCEVIANERTAELLAGHRTEIEAGTSSARRRSIRSCCRRGRSPAVIGSGRPVEVELIHAEIHSDDATVLWLADQRMLFAGDTMEDTVTYVTEPGRLAVHREELDRLRELGPQRILPNHGEPDLIATGGYPVGLIDATQEYIDALSRLAGEPELETTPLRELVAGPLAEDGSPGSSPTRRFTARTSSSSSGARRRARPGAHSAAVELVLDRREPRRARRVGERVAPCRGAAPPPRRHRLGAREQLAPAARVEQAGGSRPPSPGTHARREVSSP